MTAAAGGLPTPRVVLAACLAAFCGEHRVGAAVTFANLDEAPRLESLADAFKVSLVRPPGEPPNSGSKLLVNVSSVHLLEDDEQRVLDGYDDIFERYSMFCNGRWLGAQILQDSQDVMYLQHITYKKKPDVIIETGTYKGGLTYLFASILDWIDSERIGHGAQADRGTATVLSIDTHHPDLVFAANWFCPVCLDCIKPYATDVWRRRVDFIQGRADEEVVFNQVVDKLLDIDVVRLQDGETGQMIAKERLSAEDEQSRSFVVSLNQEKVVMVNLDANHEFEGLLRELLLYAPLVTQDSYLVVQDTKLDKIWGTAGPTAALNAFLALSPEGEFVPEPELKFHGYSQHAYLRRARVSVTHNFFLARLAGVAELSKGRG